ncbi:aldo/keto reductase [Actinomyces minihominis]|uniref:aldo/keto reductase n=1 Tax=Actinomyces minihominis TaxID=2002838 RepID=UPI0013EC2C53|nr:aldo/keto reductase [Actinomyces minihominis]
MEIRRLGQRGLAVSALGLGTLTWGRDTDDFEAAAMLQSFLEAGGTTLDVPSDWGSATFEGRVRAVGSTIADGLRDRLVLILHSGNLPEPTGGPLQAATRRDISMLGPRASKRNLIASLDTALADLGTDHVDLWVIHGPRQGISIGEIREAAQFALRTGRAHYVGAAGFSDWDFGALTSFTPGEEPFAALASPFSLLDASARVNLMPRGSESGLGFVALNPLAQGVLTGKYRNSTPPDSRAASSHLASLVEPYLTQRHARVVEAVVRAAGGLGTTPSQVALAWVLAQPLVSTAIIGPRNSRQLDAILEEPTLHLQRELRDVLTEVSLT